MTALERVRAYLDALPTLYDERDPMPQGLCIDTATDWTAGVSKELTYADLVALVEGMPASCGDCGHPLTGEAGYTGSVAYHRECARAVYGDEFVEDAPGGVPGG